MNFVLIRAARLWQKS